MGNKQGKATLDGEEATPGDNQPFIEVKDREDRPTDKDNKEESTEKEDTLEKKDKKEKKTKPKKEKQKKPKKDKKKKKKGKNDDNTKEGDALIKADDLDKDREEQKEANKDTGTNKDDDIMVEITIDDDKKKPKNKAIEIESEIPSTGSTPMRKVERTDGIPGKEGKYYRGDLIQIRFPGEEDDTAIKKYECTEEDITELDGEAPAKMKVKTEKRVEELPGKIIREEITVTRIERVSGKYLEDAPHKTIEDDPSQEETQAPGKIVEDPVPKEIVEVTPVQIENVNEKIIEDTAQDIEMIVPVKVEKNPKSLLHALMAVKAMEEFQKNSEKVPEKDIEELPTKTVEIVQVKTERGPEKDIEETQLKTVEVIHEKRQQVPEMQPKEEPVKTIEIVQIKTENVPEKEIEETQVKTVEVFQEKTDSVPEKEIHEIHVKTIEVVQVKTERISDKEIDDLPVVEIIQERPETVTEKEIEDLPETIVVPVAIIQPEEVEIQEETVIPTKAEVKASPKQDDSDEVTIVIEDVDEEPEKEDEEKEDDTSKIIVKDKKKKDKKKKKKSSGPSCFGGKKEKKDKAKEEEKDKESEDEKDKEREEEKTKEKKGKKEKVKKEKKKKEKKKKDKKKNKKKGKGEKEEKDKDEDKDDDKDNDEEKDKDDEEKDTVRAIYVEEVKDKDKDEVEEKHKEKDKEKIEDKVEDEDKEKIEHKEKDKIEDDEDSDKDKNEEKARKVEEKKQAKERKEEEKRLAKERKDEEKRLTKERKDEEKRLAKERKEEEKRRKKEEKERKKREKKNKINKGEEPVKEEAVTLISVTPQEEQHRLEEQPLLQDILPQPTPQIEVPFDKYLYPFENVVFEGGAHQGLAYCGAVRVLEEADIWPQIKRLSGTSSGAMAAALLSVGYTSYDLENFMTQNIKKIVTDHQCGYCSLMPNMSSNYGWNPGKKMLSWFGAKLKEKTGNPDITFLQVYQKYGKELCVVVTNVSQMATEYCHPKTTPDMPVRLAVRMSMGIPGLFKAVKYSHNNHTDYYVDGGVLCNYPIHCYDGWWLSMKTEDSFVRKLNPLHDVPRVFESNERFGSFNHRTLGFLLYSDAEPETLQMMLEERDGRQVSNPKTRTKLAKKRLATLEARKDAAEKHARLASAADHFLLALQDHDVGESPHITQEILEDTINKDILFSDEDFKILFGEKATVQDAFKQLKQEKTQDKLGHDDIMRFLSVKGVNLKEFFLDSRRRDVKKLSTFSRSLQDTIMLNNTKYTVEKRDIERTVGINTCYLGTLDYKMEPEDKSLLVEIAKRSTKAYLSYHIREKNPPTKE